MYILYNKFTYRSFRNTKKGIQKKNFHVFFCLLTLTKPFFWNTIRLSNGLPKDQHSVVTDLIPNCLQRLSADNNSCASKKTVNFNIFKQYFSITATKHYSALSYDITSESKTTPCNKFSGNVMTSTTTLCT